MAIRRIPSSQPLAKAQFHALLSEWFFTSEEPVVAPDVHGPTPWVHIALAGNRYRLHADSTRDGVRQYLAFVFSSNGDLIWTVVDNARGHKNKVVFGEDQTPIPGIYLYLVD